MHENGWCVTYVGTKYHKKTGRPLLWHCSNECKPFSKTDKCVIDTLKLSFKEHVNAVRKTLDDLDTKCAHSSARSLYR